MSISFFKTHKSMSWIWHTHTNSFISFFGSREESEVASFFKVAFLVFLSSADESNPAGQSLTLT